MNLHRSDPQAPLEDVQWADPAAHVAALNVLARHATSRDELREFAEMLGFATPAMRERYEKGVAERQAWKEMCRAEL